MFAGFSLVAFADLLFLANVCYCLFNFFLMLVSTLSPICKKSPPHKRFLVGCSSALMRLDEHITAVRT